MEQRTTLEEKLAHVRQKTQWLLTTIFADTNQKFDQDSFYDLAVPLAEKYLKSQGISPVDATPETIARQIERNCAHRIG